MITIAGSGPSTDLVEHVTVATKKRSVSSDYVFCAFMWQYLKWRPKRDRTPLMLYYRRMTEDMSVCKAPVYFCDSQHWTSYYHQFVREKRPPQRMKPSLGLCAVFGVVERWNPDTIGLIGYDWILDGNRDWLHDAIAEKACIESLVTIKDLRDDTGLHRI